MVLFIIPAQYFVAATFGATGCMLTVAYLSGAFRGGLRFVGWSLTLGLVSAAALYTVFFIGAVGIDLFHPFGITRSSESSIYALIVSPANPLHLQVAVLLFDSAGYEAYFRGAVQRRLGPRMSMAAAPAAALLDASIHLAAFYQYPGIALLWFGTTFVADLVWGLTFYFSKSLFANFTSHFTWDVAIFLLAPI